MLLTLVCRLIRIAIATLREGQNHFRQKLREYLAKLPTASAEEAAFMLSRFLTPKVAEAGRHHPEESVRQLSLGYLKELAEEGDPFAKEILEK
jgi:hypothetical protein